MKEKFQISLLVTCLLIIGCALFSYYYLFYTPFTFSSALLEFQGNAVRETLTFVPDEPYHTLYRDFITKIRVPQEASGFSEYILINSVVCSEGMSYYEDYMGEFVSQASTSYISNTEPNEYGCSFGDALGFEEGRQYTVAAEYVLNPAKLYESEGRHYIKFVAYERLRHPMLVKGDTFYVVGDALYEGWGLPGLDTVIYIPYEPENLDDYEILKVDRLDFMANLGELILIFIVYILPAVACLVVWLMLGKEKAEGDYPSELSQYPEERKAWEVASYFNPPFENLNSNFMPAMILDFYSRKILDLRFLKKGRFAKNEILVKIIRPEMGLDEIEKKMLSFLKLAESIENPKDGFFSIRQASQGTSGSKLMAAYMNLCESVKKKSSVYIDSKGRMAIYVILMMGTVFEIRIGLGGLLMLIPLFVVFIADRFTTLFVRFKGDYYLEYQKWRGFRKYLSNSDSMKRSPPEGVVMWKKYLVYATALGVGKKVLDEMRGLKLIDQKEYDNYCFIYTPNAFGAISSSGGGHGGGAGGGMGGGGMGGGGGGGR